MCSSSFLLSDAGNGNVDVIVLDPQGRRDVIKPRITKQSEDNYLVEYTPREPGVHSVNVFFAGTGIPKSPYGVNVTPSEFFCWSQQYSVVKELGG